MYTCFMFITVCKFTWKPLKLGKKFISFPLWRFSSHVIVTSVMALGMFTNFFWLICCYLPAHLLRSFTFNWWKKAREKSGNWSGIVKIGRWCESFSSAPCFVLWYSTLFLPMTACVISELFSKRWYVCIINYFFLSSAFNLLPPLMFSSVRPPSSLMRRWLNGFYKLNFVEIRKICYQAPSTRQANHILIVFILSDVA